MALIFLPEIHFDVILEKQISTFQFSFKKNNNNKNTCQVMKKYKKITSVAIFTHMCKVMEKVKVRW